MKKAFLAFACVILAPLFLASVSSSATYDPWADLDGDGDIDIYDVVKIAANYATTGDPGKNVSVTNWPSAHTVQQFAVNATWSGGRGGFVLHGLASGYSRMSLFIGPGSAKTTGSEYNITVWLRNILWTVYTPGGWPIDASQSVPKSFLNLTGQVDANGGGSFHVPEPAVVETVASEFMLMFTAECSGADTGWMEWYVVCYLRNE